MNICDIEISKIRDSDSDKMKYMVLFKIGQMSFVLKFDQDKLFDLLECFFNYSHKSYFNAEVLGFNLPIPPGMIKGNKFHIEIDDLKVRKHTPESDLVTEIDNVRGHVVTNVPDPEKLDKKMREELGF